MIKNLGCSVMFILLASCSSYSGTTGSNTYKLSKNGTNLVIPQQLTDENISHFYDLPNQGKYLVVTAVPPLN